MGKTCMLVQTKVHKCSSCKPKSTSEVHANQSAQVQFMQTKVHKCSLCKPKSTSEVHANQSPQVKFMQTKVHKCSSCKPKSTSEVRANQRCMRTVRANCDAHSSRLMSRVYTQTLNLHFTSFIFRTHTGYVTSIFRNVSSCVVASHVYVCSQV